METLFYGYVTWSPNKRTSLTRTGYGRFTTPCSSDASAGGSVSAMTSPSRMPTHLPRQTPRAIRRDGGHLSRGSWHVSGKSVCRGGFCLGSLLGVRATPKPREGLDCAPGICREVCMLSKTCTEGRCQVVSTGRGSGRGIHADGMTQRAVELQSQT